MSDTLHDARCAKLHSIEAEASRGNDNGYVGNDTVHLVRALCELGRIFAGIEQSLDELTTTVGMIEGRQ